MWKVLIRVNCKSFPLASVRFVKIAVLTERIYPLEINKGIVKVPLYGLVFQGRPWARAPGRPTVDCTTRP